MSQPKKFSNIFSDNPRYKRLQKPLEAAEICDAARSVSQGRFEVISFKNTLLTVAVSSSGAAANLLSESENIIAEINKKVAREAVKRIRYKITN